MAKNYLKITKLAFLGQNSEGWTWGKQAYILGKRGSPLGETLPREEIIKIFIQRTYAYME